MKISPGFIVLAALVIWAVTRARVAFLVRSLVTLNFRDLAMLAISSASASQAFSSPDQPP
jgi:hypothetical protein